MKKYDDFCISNIDESNQGACYKYRLPNVFTPGSDGHNDVLYPQSGIVQEIDQFQIYDRWGTLIFETQDMSIGWDGTYKNMPLPPDVYGYFLTFRCPNTGTLMLKKGNITLLR